jgi:type IV pilus assembly protein PilW
MTMNLHASSSSLARRTQTGFTLIELLISMAMGIALIAVVLTAYQNMSGGNRLGSVQQQMNEDAQAAFQILGQQIRSAGFNPVQARDTLPVRNLLSATALGAGEKPMGIFGCDKGFANGSGTTPATEISKLTCDASGTNASLALQYEADKFSPNLAGTTPADCTGAGVSLLTQTLTKADGTPAPANATYYLVENRYFIKDGGLSCAGNGGTPAFATPSQPLVGNIESMKIDYGVVNPTQSLGTSTASIAATRFPAGYLSATEIGDASGTADLGTALEFAAAKATRDFKGSERWELVRTVRVCLVVKSSAAILGDVLAKDGSDDVYGYYAGCNPSDSTQIKIKDRYLRKAYVMHFALRNRISL